ncbi:hypothetical protein D3C78_1539310 [compost metagenome]
MITVPLLLTVPRPAAGWVRLLTASGTLPSGSVSLVSTLIGIATPRVATLSATAVGAWFGATVIVTVAGLAEARPLASCAL